MAISVICSSGQGTAGSGALTLSLAATSTTIMAGDNIIVACARETISGNYSVLSSNNTPYTQIVPNITSSNSWDFAVFSRVASDGETSLTSSAGVLTAGLVAVYSVFRSPTSNLTVAQNSTVGLTADVDSPVVPVPSSNCAVLSIYGVPNSAPPISPPTTPSTFSLLFDLFLAPPALEVAIGWTTYPSAAPIDPGPWNNGGGLVQWAAATIVLGSTDFLPRKIPTAFSVREFLPYRRRVRMVGY